MKKHACLSFKGIQKWTECFILVDVSNTNLVSGVKCLDTTLLRKFYVNYGDKFKTPYHMDSTEAVPSSNFCVFS